MCTSYFRLLAAVGASALLAASVPAFAAEHEVKMLNKGADGMMVFEPSLLEIAPGDSVHFVAADKGHDVLSIEGMLPAGAQPFEGKMSEDLTVVFDKAGVYGYKCKPHYAMGMVGLVVVGEPTNLADAQAVPQKGKAKDKFAKLFQSALQQAAAQ